MPTLPSVYVQVEQLCEDPDVDADDLAKVIETDPSQQSDRDPALASLVHMADAVSRNLGGGSGCDTLVPLIHLIRFQSVGG